MYKLKQVGLTALAGSLITLSAAQAGGVSVGGTMEVTYTKLGNGEVSGNPLGTKKNISFSGGGEFANGWTFGIMHAMTDAMDGISSSSMNINMGGIATLAYDSGTGSYGANAADNVMPIAWEEIDYGLNAGITDVGQVSKTKGVVNFTIAAPGSGTALSLSYAARMGAGHQADGATGGAPDAPEGAEGWDMRLDLINIDTNWFGYRLGTAAEMVVHPNNCDQLNSANKEAESCLGQGEDEYGGTAYTVLRLGPLSAGYQASWIDNGSAAVAAVASNHSQVWGAALTVGNYLSFSYGQGTDEYKYNNAARLGETDAGELGDADGEYVESTYQGGSAAANWGPLSLKYVLNECQNCGGKGKAAGGGTDTHQEINLSMAF